MPLVRELSRQVLRRSLASFGDEEQNQPPTDNGSLTSKEKHLSIARTDASTLVPGDDKLLIFRSLTGIDTVPSMSQHGHARRPAPNVGIYSRVVRAEKSSHFSYRIFSLLINTCLGIQIVVAAILTALGAANGPHRAVTAFGAINTIIAGILTYVKGSGLPHKLKNIEDEWKRVREHIEQREREFCLQSCTLDVHEEILFIETMYNSVKAQMEGKPDSSKAPPPSHPNEPEHGRRVLSPSASTRLPRVPETAHETGGYNNPGTTTDNRRDFPARMPSSASGTEVRHEYPYQMPVAGVSPDTRRDNPAQMPST